MPFSSSPQRVHRPETAGGKKFLDPEVNKSDFLREKQWKGPSSLIDNPRVTVTREAQSLVVSLSLFFYCLPLSEGIDRKKRMSLLTSGCLASHCDSRGTIDRTRFDWCCFYYFVRNGLLALLEAVCAQWFVSIMLLWAYRAQLNKLICAKWVCIHVLHICHIKTTRHHSLSQTQTYSHRVYRTNLPPLFLKDTLQDSLRLLFTVSLSYFRDDAGCLLAQRYRIPPLHAYEISRAHVCFGLRVSWGRGAQSKRHVDSIVSKSVFEILIISFIIYITIIFVHT